nr:UDP-N-acetylmuramoyl-tripeptide--D-alanyl-D-alanine ligase [Cohnella sp. WQ 127256]
MQANVREVVEWSGAEGTHGLADEDGLLLSGVSTDTRNITSGQLFVPLRGERFDGHDYIQTAKDAGAAATLWDSSVPLPDIDLPFILVTNTEVALQALSAGYLKNKLTAKVVAITGSNGKTTTKDMIFSVLSTTYRVHKTEGNYNNHIGLPLTILSAPKDTEVLVLEMGMSGKGEIALLTTLAKPDIAVITNIGEAHLLQLGTRRNIARAKLEITDGLKSGGALVYYGDEPLIAEQLAATGLDKQFEIVTFGEQPDCDWIARYIRVNADRTQFTVMGTGNTEIQVELPIAGRHNAINALAAVAVGHQFNLSFEVICEGLKFTKLTGMRIEQSKANNGAIIFNDAYNASPSSVKAAINLVAELSGYRRKWIVLGDMLELGEDEIALHGEIGRYLDDTKVDNVLIYGSLSNETYQEAKMNFPDGCVQHFDDKAALAHYLLAQLASEDLVLVKASRGMRLEELVTILQKGVRG